MKDLGNLKKKTLKQEENSADCLPAQYLLKKKKNFHHDHQL